MRIPVPTSLPGPFPHPEPSFRAILHVFPIFFVRLKGLALSMHLLETAGRGVPFWSAPGPPLSSSCPPKWGSSCSLETREHWRLLSSVHHAEMMMPYQHGSFPHWRPFPPGTKLCYLCFPAALHSTAKHPRNIWRIKENQVFCSTAETCEGRLHVGLLLLLKALVAQLCLTLCDLMDCTLPGSSVHGISQARILEWVAISFSRVSS